MKSLGQFVFNLCLICETTLPCWQAQIIRFSAIVVDGVVGDAGCGICLLRRLLAVRKSEKVNFDP